MSKKTLNRNGIDRSGAHSIWIMKLESIYHRIRMGLYGDAGNIDGKRLNAPCFRINHKQWGSWNPSTRTLCLDEDLFLRFEWGAVEHVLKHEMAHQIVDEIWDFDYKGHVHGEAFKRACGLLGVSSNRCTSESLLSSFKGDGESPVVDKVRKLLMKGNDHAVSKSESEVFLRKAHELMARHSIEMHDVCGSDRLFLPRPVGPLRKCWPGWESYLSALVEQFYGVKRLIIDAYVQGEGSVKYMSLFGEPSKLDIAEYVYNAILNVGDHLYREFLSSRKAEHQSRIRAWRERVSELNDLKSENPERSIFYPCKPRQYRKASKASFMSGLLSEYTIILEKKHKDVMERIRTEEGEDTSLLLLNDPMLEEAYHKAYPRVHKVFRSGPRGDGFGAGRESGKNMRIRTGVASGSIGNTRLLSF